MLFHGGAKEIPPISRQICPAFGTLGDKQLKIRKLEKEYDLVLTGGDFAEKFIAVAVVPIHEVKYLRRKYAAYHIPVLHFIGRTLRPAQGVRRLGLAGADDDPFLPGVDQHLDMCNAGKSADPRCISTDHGRDGFCVFCARTCQP